MIIDLPEKFTMNNLQEERVAYIEDGILKLTNKAPYRKVMFELAYQMKGKKRCCYCGKIIPKERMTIDHMYPQDFGGPTITNNLLPCCRDCNNLKGNLTAKQFKRWISLEKIGKGNDYIKDLSGYLLFVRKWEVFECPKEWVSKKVITEIMVKLDLDDSYKGKKYKSISKYYDKYGHIQHPIIVDKNFFLVDGFISLMFAKNNNIRKIPVIVLENVEVIH